MDILLVKSISGNSEGITHLEARKNKLNLRSDLLWLPRECRDLRFSWGLAVLGSMRCEDIAHAAGTAGLSYGGAEDESVSLGSTGQGSGLF